MFNFLFGRGRRRSGRNSEEGRGRGQGGKPGSGPSGECVCPKCGHKVQHQVGQRCMDLPCPKCDTLMVRV